MQTIVGLNGIGGINKMKFNWIPPLVITCTFLMIGMIWYLISWHNIPEYLQKGIKENIWILIVIWIPILFWSSIDKTDEEYKQEREQYNKREEVNKAIIKKYDEMESLK